MILFLSTIILTAFVAVITYVAGCVWWLLRKQKARKLNKLTDAFLRETEVKMEFNYQDAAYARMKENLDYIMSAK